MENAIEVIGVRKKFKSYYDKGNTMKDKLLFWERNRYEEQYILDGIDFEIKKGEAVGLIGRNGCGKSTTLKLINRIIYPTEGKIIVNGRVSSLIELGAGFHPDMTGRENIYINASIFGMTRKEIDEKIESIIAFSELEEFIDNPVRTYSSGMYMRLGFAVAINVKADVLLIDEILAVGDISFQKKCFERLQEIKAQGVTIVIVSHAMDQIASICDKVIWIEKGKIKQISNPKIATAEYNSFMEEERLSKEKKSLLTKDEQGLSEKAIIVGQENVCVDKVMLFENNASENTNTFMTNKPFNISVDFRTIQYKGEKIDLRICITRNDGIVCYTCSTIVDSIKNQKNKTTTLSFDDLPLLSGKYQIDVFYKKIDGSDLCSVTCAKDFYIQTKSDIYEEGIVKMKHTWS